MKDGCYKWVGKISFITLKKKKLEALKIILKHLICIINHVLKKKKKLDCNSHRDFFFFKLYNAIFTVIVIFCKTQNDSITAA